MSEKNKKIEITDDMVREFVKKVIELEKENISSPVPKIKDKMINIIKGMIK